MLKMLWVKPKTEMRVILLKIRGKEKDSAKLCLVGWNKALLGDKPGQLAEVISKPSAKGAAGCLLAIRGEKYTE